MKVALLNLILVLTANSFDENYEEITENQEEVQREGLKRKWARLEAIVGAGITH